MIMSEGDIVLEYKQAKDPRAQIKILADENACTRKEITAILRKHGLELPGPGGRPPKAAAEEAGGKPEAGRCTEVPEETKDPEDCQEDGAERELRLYYHAVQAIARLLKKADEPGDELYRATSFQEQVRGILSLLVEVKTAGEG